METGHARGTLITTIQSSQQVAKDLDYFVIQPVSVTFTDQIIKYGHIPPLNTNTKRHTFLF
jgi:hypothetical protein